MAKGKRLVGRLDDPNPDRALARFGHDPESTSVSELSIGDAIYCYEDQSPEEVRKIMIDQDMKHMPVVDRELRILGIVTLQSLEAAGAKTPKTKKGKAA